MYSRAVVPPSDNVSVRGSSNNSEQTHTNTLCWLRGRTYSRRSKGITVVQMHDIDALWQFSPYCSPEWDCYFAVQ